VLGLIFNQWLARQSEREREIKREREGENKRKYDIVCVFV